MKNRVSKKVAFNLCVFLGTYILIGFTWLLGNYFHQYSWKNTVIYIHWLRQAYWIDVFTLYMVFGLILLISVILFSVIEYRVYLCDREEYRNENR